VIKIALKSSVLWRAVEGDWRRALSWLGGSADLAMGRRMPLPPGDIMKLV
jgi:hypothetical protein